MSWRWWILTLCATGISSGLLWDPTLPLGVPGEWTWPRHDADAASFGFLVLAAFGAAAYLGFVAMGTRRMAAARLSRLEAIVWLVGLGVAAACWLWTVQETAPTAGQLAKGPFVLYYPSSSGYFTKARYEEPDAAALLRNYEALMSEGDVLHVGTHPPGLFLVFHGLLSFEARFPHLTAVIDRWQPTSFQEAFDVVLENTARTPQPANLHDRSVLWMATLLVLGCAAATVWPLYGLLRFQTDRATAWLVASLWPTLPAVAIFIPKSDAAYPLVATGIVWWLVSAWRTRSFLGALVGGVGVWCGMLASLAVLPVLLFCGLWILVAEARTGGHPGRDGRWKWWLGAVLGFTVPIGLCAACLEINLVNVWLWNYRNHAGFYEQFPRTGWLWGVINPFELGYAVGWPLFCVAITAAVLSFRSMLGWTQSVSTTIESQGLRCTPGVTWAIWLGLGVWGLLWLSGKNSGEAARLWLLFMPGVVWLTGQLLTADRDRSQPGGPSFTHRETLLILAMQLTVSILTVHRVGGFHLASPG
jgi:methylthioxylose transferase